MTAPAANGLPTAFTDALARQGLNLFGVLTGDAYDALCPPAFQRAAVCPDGRSAIVIGSGGRDLWAAIGRSPEAAHRHRINLFTQRIIAAAVREHLRADQNGHVCLWPNDVRERAFIPILRLAVASGLGIPSRMMLLISPTYGLWIGLRGIVLTPIPLRPTTPLSASGFDPCSGCHAPCAKICHGRVISDRGYDGNRCLQTRILKQACRRTCDARLACPVGAGHQYPAEQMAHHSRHLLDWKTLGRYALFTTRRRFSA